MPVSPHPGSSLHRRAGEDGTSHIFIRLTLRPAGSVALRIADKEQIAQRFELRYAADIT